MVLNNMTNNIFMYIYIAEKAQWDIHMSHACKSIPKNILNLFLHFTCLLLQISHKKCFSLIFLYIGVQD